MANPLYGQNKNDEQMDDYQTYLDFCSGYRGNLTGTGIAVSEAEAVASLAAVSSASQSATNAATLVASAENSCNVTAAAAGTIHLPDAAKGVHLCMSYTQVPDGSTGAHHIDANGGALIATGDALNSGNVFAKQVIAGGRGNGAIAYSVVSAGTTSAPTSVRIIYTPTTANNCIGVETVIHFYCPIDGQWLVRYDFIQQGTGATGAFTVA